jgi:hypothetical protein
MYRSGTVLLFAIGLVALASMLAFGFLRSMTLQRSAGHATTIKLLSMESARAGVNHAIEQIVRDYTTNEITRLDGPARAPFRAHYRPWSMTEWENNAKDQRVIDLHDVSSENYIYCPAWVQLFWNGSYLIQDEPGGGRNTTDGRGRWIEPELYTAANGVPLAASNQWLPTAPVRFGDDDGVDVDGPGNWQDGSFASVRVNDRGDNLLATMDVESVLLNTSNGSRCAPLLLDQGFKRITYTTRAEALAARKQARYRLRYAVLVRDLDGFLLVNPDPAIDWKKVIDPDPRNYGADPQHGRVVRYMHACQNVMMALSEFSSGGWHDTLGQRFAHVFAGRGWTTNFARNSDADPLPRTFPLMYRMFDTDEWFRFLGGGWRWDRPNPTPFLSYTLYAEPSQTGGPAGNPAGGEPLRPFDGGWEWRHGNTGPQFSPFLVTKTLSGGDSRNDQNDQSGAQGSPYSMNSFGRGQNGQGNGRYGGAVDTPWSVNALTAPPQVHQSLVNGYLPPGVMQVLYVAKPAGPPPNPDKANDYKLDSASVTYWGGIRGINDLFNVSHSTAFEHYQPPARQTPAVIPDYHQPSYFRSEVGYRFPQERYPGPLCYNGADPQTNQATEDDLGKLIDLSEQDNDWAGDPHTRWRLAGGYIWGNAPGGTAVDPPTDNGWSVWNQAGDDHHDEDKHEDRNGVQVYVGRNYRWWDRWSRDYGGQAWVSARTNSFWRDLLYAYNQAISVARARHADYSGVIYEPRAGDQFKSDATLLCNSIADFDNLFTRCLGHDPANPSAAPLANQSWRHGTWGNWQRFTPTHNIATVRVVLPSKNVVTYGLAGGRPDLGAPITTPCDGTLQSQVMELIVNDFRFSLFGSHPSYTKDFRPLDFNGDGAVAFSGYTANRFVAPTQDATRQAMLIDEDSTVAGGSARFPTGAGDWATDSDGNGEISASEFAAAGITPFCMTGNMWIGRSRFWNIMVRGELYDNLLKVPVGQSTVETTLVVDPAQEAERNGKPERTYSTQVIFQHWYYNKYQGLMQRNF